MDGARRAAPGGDGVPVDGHAAWRGEEDDDVSHLRRGDDAADAAARAQAGLSCDPFEIGLRRNFRYRMELLLRVLFRARMWETIPLPDFLFGIYPLLSPFEWVVFRVRQWLAKPPSTSVTLLGGIRMPL